MLISLLQTLAEILAGGTSLTSMEQIDFSLPGSRRDGNIGLLLNLYLDWYQKVQQSKWKEQRQTISLNICNNAREVNAKYQLDGAWPTSYKVADVNASSTDFAIEELEIAFEEFKRVKA